MSKASEHQRVERRAQQGEARAFAEEVALDNFARGVSARPGTLEVRQMHALDALYTESVADLLVHGVPGITAELRPDGVLLLRPVRGMSYEGTIVNLTYEAVLVDTQKRARVWRANIVNRRASGVYGTIAGMMEESAISIAERLDADRIIGKGG